MLPGAGPWLTRVTQREAVMADGSCCRLPEGVVVESRVGGPQDLRRWRIRYRGDPPEDGVWLVELSGSADVERVLDELRQVKRKREGLE